MPLKYTRKQKKSVLNLMTIHFGDLTLIGERSMIGACYGSGMNSRMAVYPPQKTFFRHPPPLPCNAYQLTNLKNQTQRMTSIYPPNTHITNHQ